MDQMLNEVLRFDRFTLYLASRTLRVGGKDIILRPKAFDVLRHLAENAGHLVLKQDFHEVVWPGIAVTDDSLVQCIRELRQVLGDEEHRLIKTVSRRGYFLDSEPRLEAQHLPGEFAPIQPIHADAALLHTGITQPIVSADFWPARVPSSALNKLFTTSDAKRVAEIARAKQLPIPVIEFDTPDDDVPTAIRRFVGIWVSNKGFVNTRRQFMFTVTHVEKQGLAGGWTVRGPPAPNSRIQNPAEAVPFTAYISGDLLTYRNPRGTYEVWFSEQGGIVFKQTYVTGDMTMVALDPIWTLLEAEGNR